MSTPTLKRSRSSLSQSTLASPSPAGTSSSTSQGHPHPLRQTVFARDIGGKGGVQEDDEEEDDGEDDGEWRRREGDDEFEDVTRAGGRREGREGGGEEEEEGDEDEEEEEEEEEEGGGGYFPSLSIKIKPPVAPANYKRPAEDMGGLRAKKQKKGRVETEDDEDNNELFPAPDAFGVEIGDEEFSSLGGGVNVEEDEELEEILSGVNGRTQRKRRRMFGPGLTAEEIKSVISSFTDEQMDRYETFRRANINRGGVKKLANAVLNQSITNTVAVAISGFSKVFLGEVIERALDVQQRMDPGDGVNPYAAQRPLLAVHIREAWRLYRQETGMVPAAQWRREGRGEGRMFR